MRKTLSKKNDEIHFGCYCGGTIGDLCGFVAGTLRGVVYIDTNNIIIQLIVPWVRMV